MKFCWIKHGLWIIRAKCNVIICFKSIGSSVLAISFFSRYSLFYLIFQSGIIRTVTTGTIRTVITDGPGWLCGTVWTEITGTNRTELAKETRFKKNLLFLCSKYSVAIRILNQTWTNNLKYWVNLLTLQHGIYSKTRCNHVHRYGFQYEGEQWYFFEIPFELP